MGKNKIKPLQIIVICFLFIFSTGCSLMPEDGAALKPPLIKPAKPNYEIYEVKKGNISTQINGIATFVSSEVVNLSFSESGVRLRSIQVNLGDRVKKGQIVAELETGDLEARLKVQQLNLEKAQILLEQQMQANGSDKYAIRLKKIDVQSAQIQLDLIHEQLNKAKLVAPIDGVVTYVSDKQKGDTIGAYQSIVSISNPTNKNLLYEASASSDLNRVEVNMNVDIKRGGETLTGKVVQNPLSVALDTERETLDRISKMLVIKPDGDQDHFELGDQVDFSITLEHREDVIVIPRAGFHKLFDREYVQVLEGEAMKEIGVEIGIVSPTEVEIRNGLVEGQKVITNAF